MSLKWRLFLIFGGLLALLLLAQAWLVHSLAGELQGELGEAAFEVGSSVASVFVTADTPECEEEPCVEILHETSDENVRVFQWHTVTRTEEDSDPKFVFRQRFEKHEDVVRKHVVLKLDDVHEEPAISVVGSGEARRIPVPQEGFRSKIDLFYQRLLLGSLACLGVGLLLAGAVAHRVSRPLENLAEAARDVGEGELGTRVESSTGGEVGHAIAAFNTMSARLSELEAKNRELSARRHLGEIGEIARGLAHALRNPANALGLSVEELAAKAPDDPEAAELASSARRQIRRLDQTLRSFLVLASEGAGPAEEIDVAELAEDVALEVLQDTRGRVRLEVVRGAGSGALVAVAAELRAVLQALVVNAAEASPDGAEVRISVDEIPGGEGRERGVRIAVDDRGPGLAPEVRSALFTPHVSTKADGSGMGLFLAHRIATARYGGELHLDDRPGGGTRARLELGPRRDEAGDG